ncbi:MAG: gliding motility-associated ABC transporter ATP-binding subunit GldA [Bacteroidales bacterium]|nr:gliding motility-associated ABC transporter ATP-binding subunit GldA [Bacteroidales bacterium]MBN2758408.1 gliding motility-associated ABC transporter ATP-binding subunit GldA [Bacteroidales bacterium]
MSIKVNNITKLYGKQKALDNVSFEIKTGEITGFLGPNGAGKSTMMKIITGFLPANSGNVFVNDINVNENPLEVKKIIGYLPENNPLYLDMYVKEYLQFVASIHLNKKEIKQKVKNIIDLTGLGIEQNKKISSLSKGYRQRTGLAQALIHNPDILILDEPTTGLDPNQIVDIRNLIIEIGKEKTIMLSTHIMQEVEAICNKVIIIDKGKIVADDSSKKIQDKIIDNKTVVIIEFDKRIEKALLEKIEGVENLINHKENTWLIESKNNIDIRASLFNFAVKNNLTVLSLQKQEKSLEDVFKILTGNN